MSDKKTAGKILLCGPSRHSVSGVATHLNQLFASSLAQQYSLRQFEVGSEGRREGPAGKLLRFVTSPFVLLFTILRYRPDIVHLNSSLDSKSYWRDLVYLLIAKILGRSVVYQVHGGEPPAIFLGTTAVARAFLRWSLNLPDVVVLLAEVESEAYRQFKAGKSLRVIPNAIDLEEYGGTEGKDSSRPRLGYIGRLADNKGVLEAIQALAILQQRGFEDLKLCVAGSGPFEDALRARAEDLGLQSSVEFLGPVFGEEKIAFWRKTGIFVFPTYHNEGLPYTVLESLASGTPMVSTKMGGIPEVVSDASQGVLIEDHDPATVASAIETLLRDPERLRRMSRAAIARAREYYGVDRLARQFDELYRESLS